MSIELRLSEEFLLLAVNEKTGTIAPFKFEYFKYGIAAAILHELLFLQKLQLDEEMIKVLESKPFGDILLDPAVEILGQTEKQKKVRHWISKLGSKHKIFKNILLDDLINKGILRRRSEYEDQEIERRRFRKERFNIWYEIPLQRLRKRLQSILLYGKEPDPKSLRLIALIHGCKLTRQVFPGKEDYEKVIPRISALADEDVFKKAIRSTVSGNRASAVSGVISAGAMFLKEAC